MAQIASINLDKVGIAIDGEQQIVVTVKWLNGDTPITATDKYKFSIMANSGPGVVTISKPSGNTFPATVNFVADPTSNQATATITVKGDTLGLLTIKGESAAVTGKLPTTCKINVFPKNVILRYTTDNFSNPAMRITDQNYDINSTPEESKSVLVIEAVDAVDGIARIGPYYPITLLFENVRENSDRITGKFYVNGQQIAFPPRNSGVPSSANIAATTNDKGLVTLTVIANNNEGYISFTATSTSSSTKIAYIYVFNDDFRPAKVMDSPLYWGPTDLTNYTRQTVSVGLRPPGPDQGEYLGLFLNGNFEGQTDANAFAGNPTYVTTYARTRDLIVNDPGDNITPNNKLMYFLTKTGDLKNSLILTFPVTGQLPPPAPVNPILSKMLQPTGYVINLGNMLDNDNNPRTLNAIMDVQSDVTILKDKMGITLSTTQLLRIIVVSQGDYYISNQYQIDVNQFDTAITVDMLSNNMVSIPIPRDFLYGYGTPHDGSQSSQYTIWYGYVNATSDKDTFASSPVVTGPLSTRI